MPKYTPIETTLNMRASLSALAHFQWTGRSVIADFFVPDDDQHVLRVCFEDVDIIRILDEMPLSTETETSPDEGIVVDHFAYAVEGAAFWQSQSDTLKAIVTQLRHFRFFTGWECLDVLSRMEPTFLIVTASDRIRRPSSAQVTAAARILDNEGRFHGWWPKHIATYDQLDPIGKEDFYALVERVLIAAAEAR